MRSFFKFLAFFFMAIAGRLLLMDVEDVFATWGLTVPDLLPIVGPSSAREAFESVVAARVQGTYVQALWTADVLFPIGLAGMLATLIGNKAQLNLLPVLAAGMDILGENVAATLVIQSAASPDIVWMFVFCHALKWIFIGVSMAVLVVKFAVWFWRDVVYTF